MLYFSEHDVSALNTFIESKINPADSKMSEDTSTITITNDDEALRKKAKSLGIYHTTSTSIYELEYKIEYAEKYIGRVTSSGTIEMVQEIVDSSTTTVITNSSSGNVEVNEDIDGVPIEDDIDGVPLEEDIDGIPIDEEDNFRISNSNVHDSTNNSNIYEEDIDGVPIDDDIDGVPIDD
jgi:hypothetical protein